MPQRSKISAATDCPGFAAAGGGVPYQPDTANSGAADSLPVS